MGNTFIGACKIQRARWSNSPIDSGPNRIFQDRVGVLRQPMKALTASMGHVSIGDLGWYLVQARAV